MATLSRPPVRGTQSFVTVMAQVWKQPVLTAIEVLWRWLAAVPLLLLAWFTSSQALRGVRFDERALEALTVFKPTEAAAFAHQQLASTLPPLLPIARWWVPLGLVVWTAASTLGRIAIWRRLDPRLRPRYALTALLGLVRLLALLVMLGAWIWGLLAAARTTVTSPAASGGEPNLVLFVAIAVTLTLVLFMFWSLLSWVLDVAPLFAMSDRRGVPALDHTPRQRNFLGSLHAAWCARALRSKLIETNLVMGIIKMALLVLAMVFSASPLPFASVETTGFLVGWWSFVGVLYLIFSDLFQVIRRAAYLRLFQALVSPEMDTTSPPEYAS